LRCIARSLSTLAEMRKPIPKEHAQEAIRTNPHVLLPEFSDLPSEPISHTTSPLPDPQHFDGRPPSSIGSAGGEVPIPHLKNVEMKPTGSLRFTGGEPSFGDHPMYFRPRPAIDQGWLQIPKPPQLAYQREQFFANLMKKATKKTKPRSKVSSQRRSSEGKLPPQQNEVRKSTLNDLKTGGGLAGRHSDTPGKRPRGGFAGIKLLRMMSEGERPHKGEIPRPSSSSGLLHLPQQRILTPSDSLRARTAPLSQGKKKFTRADLFNSQPAHSTVYLCPPEAEEDQALPD